MWKHSSMSYHGKEVQPFQPALSLTILLFYRHAKFILQVTDEVMVSDQVQWISNFRCPEAQSCWNCPLKHDTKANAMDWSALPYSAQGWSTSDWVSKPANGSSRTKNHHAGWSDLRRSDSPCPSASKHIQLDQVARGLSNMMSSVMEIPLPLWTTCFSVWPSLWWRIFFLVSTWDLSWSTTCACCLSSHHYAPLRRVWLHPSSLHPPIR